MKPELVVLFFLTVTVLKIATPVSSGTTITTTTNHNITSILDKYPNFSTFNYFLTQTNLASEINSRQNITVLALGNSAMISTFHDKHLYGSALKNVLSLHVLDVYFDAKKLHQITNGTTVVSSMFQAYGAAASFVGYVNITILKDGRVGFSAEDNNGFHSFYVKSVEENPNDISILEISQPLSSPQAEVPPVSQNKVDVFSWLYTLGCQAFADLVRYSKALTIFTDKFHDGLTIFCPTDDAVNDFIPIYKNLTEDKRVSLLLYHGIPVFEWPLVNGVFKTLAATEEGAKNKFELTVQNYRGNVTVDTKVNTAEVVKTLIDVDPFALYRITNMLLPTELFKDDETAPAESPKPAKKEGEAPVEPPKPAKKKEGESPAESPKPARKKKGEAPVESPGDSEIVFGKGGADAPEPGSDSEADGHEGNGVIGFNNGYSFIIVFFSLFIRVLVL